MTILQLCCLYQLLIEYSIHIFIYMQQRTVWLTEMTYDFCSPVTNAGYWPLDRLCPERFLAQRHIMETVAFFLGFYCHYICACFFICRYTIKLYRCHATLSERVWCPKPAQSHVACISSWLAKIIVIMYCINKLKVCLHFHILSFFLKTLLLSDSIGLLLHHIISDHIIVMCKAGGI